MDVADKAADSVAQQPRSFSGDEQVSASKPTADVTTVVSAAPVLVPASIGQTRSPGAPTPVPDNRVTSGNSLSVVSTPTVVSSAASAPMAPGLNASLLVFRAKAASWVKVMDIKGSVLLSKTMAEGEVIAVSGDVPLTVVIGRSDAMDVEVRGKLLSLAAVSKENVARFEVK